MGVGLRFQLATSDPTDAGTLPEPAAGKLHLSGQGDRSRSQLLRNSTGATLSRGGQFETVTPNTRVELQFQAVTPDFDGDGRVGFADFLLFVDHFGTRRGDADYEALYDLDGNDAIGIVDEFILLKQDKICLTL